MRGTYRGLNISAAGPPAGGLTLLQMLNFLEGYDVGSPWLPSTEAARLLVEAMAGRRGPRAPRRRSSLVDVPTGALADKQYAAKAREAVAVAATAHDRSDTTHVCAIDDQATRPR